MASNSPFEPTTASDTIGKDLAFGLQQTAACFSTDFIDPIVGKQIQKRWGVAEHKVTDKHVWGAEIIGDLAALPIYLGVKQLFRKPIEMVAQQVKKVFSSSYEHAGRKHLKAWARENNIEKDSAEYLQKLEDYKNFQARNAVDSTIVAGSATGMNVVSQKYILQNAQPMKVILSSKLVGAAATMTLMLGLRRLLPGTTESMDQEMSKRYLTPAINHVETQLGYTPENKKEEIPAQKPKTLPTNDTRIVTDTIVAGTTGGVAMLLGHAEEMLSFKKPAHWGAAALIGVTTALGMRAFVPDTMAKMDGELEHRYLKKHDKHDDKHQDEWTSRVARDATPLAKG